MHSCHYQQNKLDSCDTAPWNLKQSENVHINYDNTEVMQI